MVQNWANPTYLSLSPVAPPSRARSCACSQPRVRKDTLAATYDCHRHITYLIDAAGPIRRLNLTYPALVGRQ